MIAITEPRTKAEFDAVRALCWEYRDFLIGLGPDYAAMVHHFYPEETYARLMDQIETAHAPPGGAIRLALLDGRPVGCGMYHTFEPGVAEIKRVFLRDAARGFGAGRALMEALIAQCRADGCRRILMDTGRVLKPAARLYLALGFRRRGPYHEVPEIARPHMIFFEMDL